MVEESFGIYVTRNSVGGSKKRRYAWQETLYMITSSSLFSSISCKVAEFSPYIFKQLVESPFFGAFFTALN